MKSIIYELAFHLNPDLEEAQAQQLAQNIENYITSTGGVVSFKKEPERIRLSYPIEHKNQAWFGYFHFNLEAKEVSVSASGEFLKVKLTSPDGLKGRSDIVLVISTPRGSASKAFTLRP